MGAVAYNSVGSSMAGQKYKELFQIPNESGAIKTTLEERADTLEYFRQKGLLRKEVE